MKVEYTNGIPICPECKKPTRRTGGTGMVTAMYYPPIYDENGVNTNPDRNCHTQDWECYECGTHYCTAGNEYDGHIYTHIQKQNKHEI